MELSSTASVRPWVPSSAWQKKTERIEEFSVVCVSLNTSAVFVHVKQPLFQKKSLVSQGCPLPASCAHVTRDMLTF